MTTHLHPGGGRRGDKRRRELPHGRMGTKANMRTRKKLLPSHRGRERAAKRKRENRGARARVCVNLRRKKNKRDSTSQRTEAGT